MVRLLNTTYLVLSFLAALFTLLLALQYYTDLAKPEVKFVLQFLAGLLSISLIILVFQEYRFSRKARYAEINSLLNNIFYDAQTLASKREQNTDLIRKCSEHILNTLARAFSIITTTRCSVCIKIIESDPEAKGTIRPKVRTLCRDTQAKQRTDGTVEHWIDQNSDFEMLHEAAGTPQGWFFCNYLPGIRGYKNTSFQTYGGCPIDVNIPIIGDILRDASWKLPYKSSMVVPIMKRQGIEAKTELLAGYLCIDSRSRGAFSKRYDIDLLQGVSDVLYEPIHNYNKLIIDTHHQK